MMTRLRSLALFVGMTALFLGMTLSASAACIVTQDGSGLKCQTLLAGQTIEAGFICAIVEGNALKVTYSTSNGWELVEVHLWVGADLADMPQTKQGNPKIGNFPHKSGDITGLKTYSFLVPLDTLGFSCPGEDKTYYVAAHAALRKPNGDGGYQTETGWADGDKFVDKGMWGTYFSMSLSCECNGTGEPETCETAFAKSSSSSQCFLDINLDGDEDGDFNRWGWTNGPVGPGTHTFELWAGAGQCDTSKGALVGTVTVNYDGSTAMVKYETVSPYSMDEIQLYVGNEILPRDVNGEFTVAPGQYTEVLDNLNGVTSKTIVIEGLSGDVFIVAHATVCQPVQ